MDPNTLSLSSLPLSPPPTPPPHIPNPPHRGKSVIIPPPFPWSRDLRAKVRSLEYLRSHRISRIWGDVHCKQCNGTYRIEFDLEEKFREVAAFIDANAENMYERAPTIWMDPARLTCTLCNQTGSVGPAMPEKKRSINWLFLFLGQMLGCYNESHLRYYLKHNRVHRTGGKSRLVYMVYLDIFKKLREEVAAGGSFAVLFD